MTWKSSLWCLGLVSSLALTGCLETVLGVLLVPEVVIAQSVGQAAQAGAQSLTEMGVDQIADFGQTVADLNRYISQNPEAANIEELSRLQDRLARLPVVRNRKTAASSRGDRILLPPPRTPQPRLRCTQGCPDTLPDGGAIAAGREEPWLVATEPVRIR